MPTAPAPGTLSGVAECGPGAGLISAVLTWYDHNERPLPWRGSSPWGVLVSEFMLQQTPVERVRPLWESWLDQWPRPADLAAAPLADAIRAWGRLGYPRRARYLHRTAEIITADHGGAVPADLQSLRALPGVGEYTAAAVQAFAFGRRAIVLDTNVRRVLARAVDGSARPTASISAIERAAAQELWPRAHRRSARWSAAVMELGAVVCTARNPSCHACPIRRTCAWSAAGFPPADRPTRRQPAYEGSDRQARGAILAVARRGPVEPSDLALSWPSDEQRVRAIEGLLADGLLERAADGRLRLPT